MSLINLRTTHVRHHFYSYFKPAAAMPHLQERWRVTLCAALTLGGMAFLTLLSQGLWPDQHLVLLAPLGATALLMFAAPASPMSQPYPVLVGNSVSAVLALVVSAGISPIPLAVGTSVAGAIGAMFVLRCLHPPGAAMALLVVMTAPHAHPVDLALSAALGSLALVLMGSLLNNLTGRQYPSLMAEAGRAPIDSEWVRSPRFSARDLDAVLQDYNQVIDVSPEQLEDLLARAQTRSYERHLGAMRCRDVMTPTPLVVTFNQTAQEAWLLMQERHIKALPVVDKNHQLVGIVSLSDVVSHAPMSEGLPQARNSTQTVAQIMTRRVRVASADAVLVDLVPLFSQYGQHHLPVLDANNRLVGILTQSDMVRALFSAVAPAGSQAP